MNTRNLSTSRILAQFLRASESPREIPDSNECRIENRIQVTFPRLCNGVEKMNTWDAVFVGLAGLLLVENWQRITGATEDSPAPGAIFVADGRSKLTLSNGGQYTLDQEFVAN